MKKVQKGYLLQVVLVIMLMILIALPVSAETVSEEWVQRYNGLENGMDLAQFVTVDSTGNIIVSGICGSNYCTLKYDNNGTLLWENVYSGMSLGINSPVAFEVDADDNIIVTGFSKGNGTNYDYATVKYAPDGTLLWERRYSGLGGDAQDIPEDMTVDAVGNIIITGYSYNTTYADSDYATLKYDANGTLVWEQRYGSPNAKGDTPVAVITDTAGNVIVTGSSDGDYLTIKYNADGAVMWEERYDGPGNTGDAPVAIALDGAGNVVITGISRGVDTMNDYATLKYDADTGSMLWVQRYDGPINSFDIPIALALDSGGNVVVTGRSIRSGGMDPFGDNTDFDYATVKYSPNGTELWVQRYNGPADFWDYPRTMVLDSMDNIIVTGSSDGIDSMHDIATVKYGPNGSELWVQRYDGPGHDNDYPNTIIVDGAGNTVIAGWSVNNNNSDFATLKYGSDGTLLWSQHYNGLANGHDTIGEKGVCLDADGNVFVAGMSDNSDYNKDFVTIKYLVQNNSQPSVLTISPPSGKYLVLQDFDMALIVESLDNTATVTNVTLNGSDLTNQFNACAVKGTITAIGTTFRCPNLSGSIIGEGTNNVSSTITLNDGTTITDSAVWQVIQNTEP
ncbi:MAG: PQQ-binding-like beta-propeller repeat protein [Deltaproteobacteria bacterium]|nr:PQQ-binding-like beta-propeller repeat protein [Deltaproteobacteria bacterium]